MQKNTQTYLDSHAFICIRSLTTLWAFVVSVVKKTNMQISLGDPSTSLSLSSYCVPNLFKYKQKIGKQRQDKLQTKVHDHHATWHVC